MTPIITLNDKINKIIIKSSLMFYEAMIYDKL